MRERNRVVGSLLPEQIEEIDIRLEECRLLRRRLNRERPKPGAELSQQMTGWFDGIQWAIGLIKDRERELKKGTK